VCDGVWGPLVLLRQALAGTEPPPCPDRDTMSAVSKEQTYTHKARHLSWSRLSNSPPVFLFCLSVHLSARLSIFLLSDYRGLSFCSPVGLSICLSVFVKVCLSFLSFSLSPFPRLCYLYAYLCVYFFCHLQVFLFVCLSRCLSVCLSVACHSISTSVCLYWFACFVSVYTSFCLSVLLSIRKSVYLFICQSVICQSVCVSGCLYYLSQTSTHLSPMYFP